MKLYEIKVDDVIVDWAGTQVDARLAAKEKNGSWAEHEVPVDKPSLLAWLKEHATGKDEAGDE